MNKYKSFLRLSLSFTTVRVYTFRKVQQFVNSFLHHNILTIFFRFLTLVFKRRLLHFFRQLLFVEEDNIEIN